jgi:mRNA interferase YafQ
LPPRCKDHALKNDWSGYRDAHIEPDWLLIYRMDQDIVRFERTGCWLQWYAVTPAKLCRRLA